MNNDLTRREFLEKMKQATLAEELTVVAKAPTAKN